MSLPLQAINRLFDRLAATYGSAWLRQWDGMDPAAIKSLWAHELSGYEHNLAAIAWALENLPETCPNLIQFRNLCRKAPEVEQKRLAPPPADPAIVADALAKISAMTAKKPAHGYDYKAWAKRIMQRVTDGELVNPTSARMAREALRLDRETA